MLFSNSNTYNIQSGLNDYQIRVILEMINSANHDQLRYIIKVCENKLPKSNVYACTNT